MSTMRTIRRVAPLAVVAALIGAGLAPVAAVPMPALVAPTATLQMPVRPAGLAIAADGSTYVANYGAGVTGSGVQVSVFDPGATTRNEARTLTGLSSPWDVAISRSTGEIAVSNFTANTISVFDPGATTAKRTLTGVPAPTGLDFDGSGRLIVASSPAAAPYRLYIFAGTATTPTDTITLNEASGGIAVDLLRDWLYVTHPKLDVPLPGTVQVIELATKSTLTQLTVTGIVQPMDIAWQLATGRFFVSSWSNGGSSQVLAFERYGTTSIAAASLGPVTGPWGVAVSRRDGAVSVSDFTNHVRVFPSVTSSITKVQPNHGPVTGGTDVSIDGVNLGAGVDVRFNGLKAPFRGPPFPDGMPVVSPPAAVAGPVTVEVRDLTTIATLPNGFTYDPVAPERATGVSGQPGNGQVTVRWTPPAFTGGVPIAGYQVTPSPAGVPCSTAATSPACTISGLANGQKYRFRVTTTNTAGLSSISEASPEVTPYIATRLTVVKAKAATYKPKRRGSTTLISAIRVPANATRVVTRSCSDGTARTSKALCTFTVYKSGKVKVRTKGYRNVVVHVTAQSVPKASAGPTFGPSPLWSRFWKVK